MSGAILLYFLCAVLTLLFYKRLIVRLFPTIVAFEGKLQFDFCMGAFVLKRMFHAMQGVMSLHDMS
jgi:hypothetical protein